MQSENRLFDDFVKVMNGAAGTLAGMTREAQAAMQERFRDWIGGLDLIKRVEFVAATALEAVRPDLHQPPGLGRGGRPAVRHSDTTTSQGSHWSTSRRLSSWPARAHRSRGL